jgi:putative ubiquitin-RnfH superfamily antitoxin RatB of RatAB toxin-antitoxin module
MRVEVVYALPGAEDAVCVTLERGATLADAVSASRIPERHPEIDVETLTLGVFGKARAPGSAAADGDRIEIYRPLVIDPKDARRKRARRGVRR